MKFIKDIIIGMTFLVFLLLSCEPRIELEKGQWGDHAFITGVELFTINEEEHELQEYYENDETITGIRREFVSTTSSIDTTDLNNPTVTVSDIPSGTDMTNVGLVIRHEAVKIEPLDGSPKPGFLDDFSNGPYSYRVISADGTERDWTISFEVE